MSVITQSDKSKDTAMHFMPLVRKQMIIAHDCIIVYK